MWEPVTSTSWGWGVVRFVQVTRSVLVFFALFTATGCVFGPAQSDTSQYSYKTPIAERDLLAEAAEQVGIAPWPKPQSVSLFSRIAGGGDEARFTKSDAVAHYVDALVANGGFDRLTRDAGATLAAAEALNLAALEVMEAPRHSMNDVVLIETAIQTLREHRQIYDEAGEKIEKHGLAIDDAALEEISDEFRQSVKTLGKTADLLADHIDEDRTATYASPSRLAH